MCKLRNVSVLLLAVLLLLCAGCGKQTSVPTEPPTSATAAAPTETTAPPQTDPPPQPLPHPVYTEAKAELVAAESVQITVEAKRARTVGTERFTDEWKQELQIENISGDTVALSEETHSFSAVEDAARTLVYADGTVYEWFEGLRYQSPMTREEFLAAQIPWVLLDESLYGAGTVSEGTYATDLTFTEPSALEQWVPGAGELTLITAGGTASVKNGMIREMGYTAEYLDGTIPNRLEIHVYVRNVDSPMAVSARIPKDPGEHQPLPHPDVPLLLRQSMERLCASGDRSVDIVERIYSEADRLTRTQEASFHTSGTGEDFRYCLDNSILTQAGKDAALVEVDENLSGDTLQLTVSGKKETKTVDAELREQCEDYLEERVCFYLPALEAFETAELTEDEDFLLLEVELGEEGGILLQALACQSLYQDPNALFTSKINFDVVYARGSLSVSRHTGLPVSMTLEMQCAHLVERLGGVMMEVEYSQNVLLGSPGALEAITDTPPEEEEPAEKPTPLFYHVTGPEGGELWLLGSIHVGDNRTAFLPKEITDAFDSADALALEIDTEAFSHRLDTEPELQAQVSQSFYYSKGDISGHLSKDMLEAGKTALKKIGKLNSFAYKMKPVIWSQLLSGVYLDQGYTLRSEKGVEQRLTRLAEEQHKQILDIEDPLEHTVFLGEYPDAVQQLLLEDVLSCTLPEYIGETEALYEQWCAGDEAGLIESNTALTGEETPEELEAYEIYKKAMIDDRNRIMADKALSYLQGRNVVFFSVGVAHLVGDGGVVDMLRQAGCTVEQVSYS